MFKRNKKDVVVPKDEMIVATIDLPDTEPRSEILAGGFVYEYPYTKNGSTYSSLNITRLAKYIVDAKTPEEKQERIKAYPQVAERETAIVMESILKTIKEKVAEEMAKKQK